jgi:O-acetyl-ADP-ribose deacetylase (regulator of RNase III)
MRYYPMEAVISNSKLILVQGDITTETTEAIVNAANTRLMGGGGVDGAIHAAGGPQIMEECRKIGGCLTGGAVITSGGNLKAKYVIHTVGPIWRGGNNDEKKLLASAYRSSLELASKNKIKSISFPSISTGAYSYPTREAAQVALTTIMDYLKEHAEIELVRFVLFGAVDLGVYEETLKGLMK